MKKKWGLLEKILQGEKKAESRWYRSRSIPWDRIKPADRLWFKNSGEPVTVTARVSKVLQFAGLNRQKSQEILAKYGKSDLGVDPDNATEEVMNYFKEKNYCILVFFDQVRKIEPFEIDKTGFGAMSAWICCDDIEKITVK